MPKLNQIIAVEGGKKTQVDRILTDIYQRVVQKPELFAGLNRKYLPKDDDGEQLPGEYKLPQTSVGEVQQMVSGVLTELFDITLTKDAANTQARADVVVDGTTVLRGVPVTTLLFLEKKLTDIKTLIGKMPILDPAVQWHLDEANGVYRSENVRTVRTQKVRKNWVKAEATKEHPAQVDVFTEDVTVGYWDTERLSGAIPLRVRDAIAARADALLTAVKFAREEANELEAQPQTMGAAVFGYLFGS